MAKNNRGGKVGTYTEAQTKAMEKLRNTLKKERNDGETFTAPTFRKDTDGNLTFEYEGTKTIRRPKGGKMASPDKDDIVEKTTKYTGRILTDGDKAIIERKSKSLNEKVIKKGRLKTAPAYKTVKQAPDYIKEQTGLDIKKFHNDAAKQFEKRGQITIDISDMTKTERSKLSNALRQKYSPYTGEQSGTWLFTITKKK